MATTTRSLGDIASRAAPGRVVLRHAMARLIAARQAGAGRIARASLLGLDDATLATFGYDRMAVDDAGRGSFPL